MAETEVHALVVRLEADLSDVEKAVAGLAPRIEKDFTRPTSEAGRAVGEVLEGAFARVGSAIESAAAGGKQSFGDMVRSLVEDLKRLAIRQFVIEPLTSALGSIFSKIFGGARAMGGPVAPGRAYLVGERGPELFAPATAGQIVPNRAMGRGVTVNFHFPPGTDVERFRRSESQIAAMMNRVVARGGRNS